MGGTNDSRTNRQAIATVIALTNVRPPRGEALRFPAGKPLFRMNSRGDYRPSPSASLALPNGTGLILNSSSKTPLMNTNGRWYVDQNAMSQPITCKANPSYL